MFRKKRSVRAAKRHKGRTFADCYEGTPVYNPVAYRASGAPFIVLKATEGIGHIDSRHAPRSIGSHAAGIAVGHYHFYREDGRPELQAKHFWNTVKPHFLTEWPAGKGHDKAKLAHTDFLIVDVEPERGSPNPTRHEVENFCRELLRVSGLNHGKLIGYTGKSYLFEAGLHIPGDKWWIADYPNFPGNLGGGRELWAHQFTENGRIAGISSPCDLSVIVNRDAIRYWEAQ